jgi:protocatechuate 3,4-dioxygenase beta subunit
VRRARVTLTGTALPAQRVVDTDTNGGYRFERLPAGEFRITVQKPGYIRLESDARPAATLTMVRGGAIAGIVADSGGDPIWNVVVTALQGPTDGSKPRTVAQARTDDLGRYRLHSLAEGDYYVEVATDAAYAQAILLRPGEKRPETSRAYYPASVTIEDAKPVHVTLGRDTNTVDLTFTPNAPAVDPSAPAPPARPDATGTARIAGRVIDAVSGKPIRNARLLLLPVDGQRLTNWQRTNNQGRFEYTSLQARRYTLSAQADGFVSLEFGQKRPGESGTQILLEDGGSFTADITLPRASAIEGTLLDEFGDPAPSVVVQIATRQYAAGRQRLMPLTGRLQLAVTDDLGRYRIAAVPPGDYYVSGLSGAYTDANEVGGFAPTYFPGTTDSGAAAPVTVSFGADASAAFSLVPAKTLTVAGVMVDSNGRPVTGRGTVWLATPDRLQRADFNLARGATAPDGRFVLRNVPQGSYTMQGFGPPPPDYRGPMNLGAMPFGWLPITVGDVDLDDVTLKVAGGVTMRGKLVFEDSGVPPPKSDELRVTAIPVEYDSAPVGGGPAPSETRGDFTFEVTRLSGMRRVFVSSSSPAWTLKKIILNGSDITDTAVDLRSKDVDGVEVVLTSKVSRLGGGVSDDKGPIADYVVVIFSSDPSKWIDRSRFVLTARPTQQGRFDVRGMPPDDYLLVALPSVAGSEWQDPDFLQQIRSQATPLSIMEGEAKTVELRLKKRP